MKIAVLTQPLHANYGGLLQAFALQVVLRRMGHDVLTVDWAQDSSYLRWSISCCKALIRKLMLRQSHIPLSPRKVMYMRRFTNGFIASNIATTNPMRRISAEKLKDYGFEAYVVGSDQVWRMAYNSHIDWMYLSFVSDRWVKRVAYAASIGIDHWDYPPKTTALCAKLAQRFDGISVRENDAVHLVQTHLGITAEHVLDPTMLLNCKDYEDLLGLPPISATSDIAVYILDFTDEKRRFLTWLAERLHCNIHVIGNPQAQDPTVSCKQRQVPPVEDWLTGLRQADYVVTDSFHGSVFSIIFHKQFICLGNKDRGSSRFNSLFGMFGLENRQFDIHSDRQDTAVDLLRTPIDWQSIDSSKYSWQKRSLNFLKTHLR